MGEKDQTLIGKCIAFRLAEAGARLAGCGYSEVKSTSGSPMLSARDSEAKTKLERIADA